MSDDDMVWLYPLKPDGTADLNALGQVIARRELPPHAHRVPGVHWLQAHGSGEPMRDPRPLETWAG